MQPFVALRTVGPSFAEKGPLKTSRFATARGKRPAGYGHFPLCPPGDHPGPRSGTGPLPYAPIAEDLRDTPDSFRGPGRNQVYTFLGTSSRKTRVEGNGSEEVT